MKKIYLILIINLFIFNSAKSQISYEDRIEIDLKDGYSNERIYEFGKHGFIMSSKNKKTTKNKTEWKFEKYNTELKLTKTKKVLLDKKIEVDEIFNNKKRLHTFFKDNKGNFSIVTIDPSDMKLTQVNGTLPKKTKVRDMSILGDNAFFSTSIKKAPFLYLVNWKTGKEKLIPISIDNIKPKKVYIKDFQVLENSNEIFVYAKAIVDKRKSDIYVIRLNNEGLQEEFFNLTKGIDENIIDVSALKLDEDKYIFTGTYSTEYTSLSEGLYFCQTKDNKIDFIEFYSFLDLENFLSYLPEKKQEKIIKKKEKKEKKGKELKYNYSISPHEIIPLDDGYLFLGEAYYDTYRNETYTRTSTVNGVTRTTTHTRLVFDGYQYTHAILGKFDKKGKLLWDETFEMRSAYKPFYVKQFISIAEKNNNSIKLIFSSFNEIHSKSINYDGVVLNDFKSEDIQTNFKSDKVKRSFSNINYWYENYFIAYGSQKIKNKDDKANTKRKRKVYFINKIKYEN